MTVKNKPGDPLDSGFIFSDSDDFLGWYFRLVLLDHPGSSVILGIQYPL
jgi:hypothetical protein